MKMTLHMRNSILQHNALIWIAGIFFFVFAEIVLFYVQIAIIGIKITSVYFWFLPIVISGPTSSGITLYRKSIISFTEGESKPSLVSFSYLASTMILIANVTVLTVMLVVLMRLK